MSAAELAMELEEAEQEGTVSIAELTVKRLVRQSPGAVQGVASRLVAPLQTNIHGPEKKP